MAHGSDVALKKGLKQIATQRLQRGLGLSGLGRVPWHDTVPPHGRMALPTPSGPRRPHDATGVGWGTVRDVYHEHDGGWQILCGTTLDAEDGRIVHFALVVEQVPALLSL